jgi:hypothetical protein
MPSPIQSSLYCRLPSGMLPLHDSKDTCIRMLQQPTLIKMYNDSEIELMLKRKTVLRAFQGVFKLFLRKD